MSKFRCHGCAELVDDHRPIIDEYNRLFCSWGCALEFRKP